MTSNTEMKAIDKAISLMTDKQKDKALKSAILLHDYIMTNAGENADWPLQICSTEEEVIIHFHNLITDFRKAIIDASK
jgi:hypothetical protein